jgi:LmbE family N-acetylglucosaminyl deacetylase
MEPITRRRLLAGSAGMAALPLAGLAQEGGPAKRRLKAVFAGGHPDDPESCAGGTMAVLADQGHEVVALYLTRGEVGIKGKSKEDVAAQRTSEALKACEILKVRPRFVGQVDGSTEVNAGRYDEFRKVLEDEKPDLVFTHWPIDTHRDHRAVASFVYDAWVQSRGGFTLFYFPGSKNRLFAPTDFVDISAIEERKRAACFCHTWYRDRVDLDLWSLAETLHRYWGMQAGVARAEAFARYPGSPRPLA